MKKGFTLLETIIVITFVSVSLLLLYNTFINLVNNKDKDLLYDDVSNIYKTYYLKEYLFLNKPNLNFDNNIVSLSCSNFSISNCNALLSQLNVHNMYLVKNDINNLNRDEYSSSLTSYLDSLPKDNETKYRFVVEFNHKNKYSYASIQLEGDIYE